MSASLTIAEHGCAHFENVLEPSVIDAWLNLTVSVIGANPGARQTALPESFAASLLANSTLGALADALIGTRARLVRVLLFDKTPDANWGVPWHQDRSIAVRERADVSGFDCWTEREFYWQVEPPIHLLEQMITLRVHLDDCGENNGPLLVIPETHLGGRLSQPEIGTQVDSRQAHICVAGAGDVVAMRPLLIHSSRKSRTIMHRRVIHLEYAAVDLPTPLCWALTA